MSGVIGGLVSGTGMLLNYGIWPSESAYNYPALLEHVFQARVDAKVAVNTKFVSVDNIHAQKPSLDPLLRAFNVSPRVAEDLWHAAERLRRTFSTSNRGDEPAAAFVLAACADCCCIAPCSVPQGQGLRGRLLYAPCCGGQGAE